MTKKRQRYMIAQSQSYHFTCPKVGVASVGGRGRKEGVAVDSGTPSSSLFQSCLVLSSGLSFGVPADRSKTVLFMPEKWAWLSEKGAWQGGIKGARCPTPCHAPLGSLGGDSGPFLAGKSPFFAVFRRFSSLVFWLFGAPKVGVAFRGGLAGAPAPHGSPGGSGPGGIHWILMLN